jgi:hypothetical protein
VRKFSKGVKVYKLRRDSSFMILGGRTQEKVRARRSLEVEEISEKEIDNQGSQRRIAKSR